MPIVLSLTGRLFPDDDRRISRSEANDWLARAAAWFEGVGDAVLDAQLVRDADDRPGLLVLLHPAAPPVEIRLGGSARLRVSASTSPAGPGYHQYLVAMLLDFAKEFTFRWVADDCSDPTDYFVGRNRHALEQHFLNWLASECAKLPRELGLPPGIRFTYPGEVLTPLGPRTHSWASAIAADPACGVDFFPWWDPRLDAAFYRYRALVRLWCDFPWRPPLTEAEGEQADQIANDLATAFKLNPGTELPWTEWLEVLAAIQADASREQFCVTPTDPVLSIELWKRAGPIAKTDDTNSRIGYLRHPVHSSLDGGWNLTVPGEFVREWDDERNWTAWNESRTVWFRRVGFTKPGGGLPSAAESLGLGRKNLPVGEPVPGIDRPGVIGEAVFGPVEEDGRTVWRLSGVAGAVGQVAVCYFYLEAESDRDWAIGIWQTLRQG